MQVIDTPFPEVKVFVPKKHGDHRGFFSETYSARALEPYGITDMFVQDNQSFSAEPYTFRGLHFQKPPFAQMKLVRALRGAALDIVVDIRKGSPNYGKHITVELRADAWNQILVPEGFAHGILTLEPDTELYYKVNRFYSPENDRGILWSDPALNLRLPVDAGKLILSPKDQNQPLLAAVDSPFVYS
jgi:dTDP-4-dehydrorhamnose 3,5-epimerase